MKFTSVIVGLMLLLGPVSAMPADMVRVCFDGAKTAGINRHGERVFCAKCYVTKGSLFSIERCRDFNSIEEALRYWDAVCCD